MFAPSLKYVGGASDLWIRTFTVADVRHGALSGSSLKEARSWGKVDSGYEQMVYAEATSVLPLIVSHVYHTRSWEGRQQRKWNKMFE